MNKETHKKITKSLKFRTESESGSHIGGGLKMLHFTALKNHYSSTLYVGYWPTNNCQLSTLGSASNINKLDARDKDRIKCFMDKLRTMTLNQILIDVKQAEYAKLIRRLAPFTEVVISNNYKSTNGSKMRLAILKWTI